jgi:hypothetical protein
METKQHGAIRQMMKESIEKPNGITVARAYQIAIDYLESENEAMDLLTSDKCNFSKSEINYMLYQKEYKKNYYNKSKALNPVHAF